jgi:WD40 repeat protein
MCVRFDGRIVSGSNDKTLRVWDVSTGVCELELEGHDEGVYRVCMLPDGRIVSGSWDKTIRVWDTLTGACERVLQGNNHWAKSMCVLPDGRIVSGSYDNTLRVWNVFTGECERVLDDDHRTIRRALDASTSISGSAAPAVVRASSVALSSTDAFVCESPVKHAYVAPSGLVFAFCESGRLCVLDQVSAASP